MGAGETITLIRPATKATATVKEAAPSELPRVEIPKRLGAVSLIREIGKGGMGVVWLGRHEMLNRDVAVKFLLNFVTSDDDPHFATFLEGARAAAAISHRGLNAVLNADVVEGIPFIVMEYVEGPTLAHVLQKVAPFPLAAARVLMESACDAVGVLHDQGIIHRDIKPANILLAPDGSPVLTDFGLACSRPVTTMGSRVEGVAGTPDYMAPEMFDRTVSPRSDVYALGIMMFELLTGNTPYTGDFEQIRAAHRDLDVPLDSVREVHPGLADVIQRATTRNPMFRTKTARHMLQGVQEAFAELDQMVANRAKGEAELAGIVTRWGKPGTGGPATPTPELGATYYDRLSTIAAKRKGSDPAGEELAPRSPADLLDRVAAGATCVRCRGPIGGEPATGRCPGCLLLVRYSVDPEAYAEMQRAAAVAPKAKPVSPEAAAPPKTKSSGFWRRLFGG